MRAHIREPPWSRAYPGEVAKRNLPSICADEQLPLDVKEGVGDGVTLCPECAKEISAESQKPLRDP
jgi:hypothetical protein